MNKAIKNILLATLAELKESVDRIEKKVDALPKGKSKGGSRAVKKEEAAPILDLTEEKEK